MPILRTPIRPLQYKAKPICLTNSKPRTKFNKDWLTVRVRKSTLAKLSSLLLKVKCSRLRTRFKAKAKLKFRHQVKVNLRTRFNQASNRTCRPLARVEHRSRTRSPVQSLRRNLSRSHGSTRMRSCPVSKQLSHYLRCLWKRWWTKSIRILNAHLTRMPIV
jgi:hypothetical protein